ncbi:PREDICTED: olfactory receptor 1019-like [Nanorana parkeri]|uniref:olfactory receptor 1019-like n=1 Tax=Nanorana parkeri TaxID=125878 RepID=UPI0008544CB8|nr:PREDICTED: olfactory receptor 1019-like [Nanorana parkeri]
MYFFLGNLAGLDFFCSSVTVPRMLFDLLTQRRKITITLCITQVFFFIFFTISEMFLLAAMSYDRFIAICQPLHYIQVMSWKACVKLVFCALCLGFTYSITHTLFLLKLTFCGSDIIESFFCDLPQLLQISCSDIYINTMLILLLGGFLGGWTLILTFLPYVFILKTVFTMQVKGKRSKVLSTCTSHLTVVFIFYCSAMFNYFQPSGSHFTGDKVLSVFYSVILPLLNPPIYTMRNQDFRTTFGDVLREVVPNSIRHH